MIDFALEADLNLATDLLGNPLRADLMAAIRDLVSAPSLWRWQRARQTIICGSQYSPRVHTLWQFVERLDPSTDYTDVLPDVGLIRVALASATH